MKHKFDVIVVGAGPVGITCALSLFRQGLTVCVLEKEPAPVLDQRAASVQPSTLDLLDELGIVEGMVERGLQSPIFQFYDRITGDIVARFDLTLLKNELKYPFVLQYEQYKFTRDITEKYLSETDFATLYSHSFVNFENKGDYFQILVETPDGEAFFEAKYLVGADGSRSTVRQMADIEFEGFTYEERFLKIATDFDFQSVHPEYVYRNYFSDPEEWCNFFRVKGERPEGLWRAVFPTRRDESAEEALKPESIERRLNKFFPDVSGYNIEYANVYTVGQRVAKTFYKDRICLAGDASHINNPIGGMGMNGGIHDAINLAEKLAPVIKGQAKEDLLNLYSRQRRFAAIEYVQAQTIANKKLLEERDLEVRKRNLEELRKISENEETARAYVRKTSLLESLRRAAEIN